MTIRSASKRVSPTVASSLSGTKLVAGLRNSPTIYCDTRGTTCWLWLRRKRPSSYPEMDSNKPKSTLGRGSGLNLDSGDIILIPLALNRLLIDRPASEAAEHPAAFPIPTCSCRKSPMTSKPPRTITQNRRGFRGRANGRSNITNRLRRGENPGRMRYI